MAATEPGKVTLIAGVTADLTSNVKAGELVNFVAKHDGKGGGRPDMAQRVAPSRINYQEH